MTLIFIIRISEELIEKLIRFARGNHYLVSILGFSGIPGKMVEQ